MSNIVHTFSKTKGVLNLDQSGNLLTSDTTLATTATALTVVGGGVEATALRVTVASDSTGVLTVDNAGTFAIQETGTGLTRLTDIETNTNSLAIVGGGVESTALRVTVASDSTGVLNVNVAKTPVMGSQGNLSNGVLTVGSDETSTSVNTIYTPNLSIFGHVDQSCVITAQVSADNITFYDTITNYSTIGAGDFFMSFVSSAPYVRLKYSNSGTTVTATVCGMN